MMCEQDGTTLSFPIWAYGKSRTISTCFNPTATEWSFLPLPLPRRQRFNKAEAIPSSHWSPTPAMLWEFRLEIVTAGEAFRTNLSSRQNLRVSMLVSQLRLMMDLFKGDVPKELPVELQSNDVSGWKLFIHQNGEEKSSRLYKLLHLQKFVTNSSILDSQSSGKELSLISAGELASSPVKQMIFFLLAIIILWASTTTTTIDLWMIFQLLCNHPPPLLMYVVILKIQQKAAAASLFWQILVVVGNVGMS